MTHTVAASQVGASAAIRARKIVVRAGDPPITDGVLVIDGGGRIAAAGTFGQVSLPTDVQVLDFGDRCAIPGLIDMHAHLLMIPEPKGGVPAPNVVRRSVPEVSDQMIRAVRHAADCVESGVTTVRDAGAGHEGIFNLTAAIDRGQIVGPRIFSAGEGLTSSGGHGHGSVAMEVDGEVAIRAAIRQQFSRGASWVKLIITSGMQTPHERPGDIQFTREEVRAACDEAHRRAKRVMAHTGTDDGVILALECGVDCVEHGLQMGERGIKALAASSAFYAPTLSIFAIVARVGQSGGFLPSQAEFANALLGPHRDVVRSAHRAGVKIVAGSDGGNLLMPFPGLLAEELIEFVNCGMSPTEALASATSVAAACLDRSDDLGSLCTGALADIVIVDGDPTAHVGDIKKVHAVFKGGKRCR